MIFANGSSLQSSPSHIEPKIATVVIGVNNALEWINQDSVPDIIVSDSNYVDPVGGNFSSFSNVDGGYILPDKKFNFTFTQPGNYSYHTIPHPWMQGEVIVLPP